MGSATALSGIDFGIGIGSIPIETQYHSPASLLDFTGKVGIPVGSLYLQAGIGTSLLNHTYKDTSSLFTDNYVSSGTGLGFSGTANFSYRAKDFFAYVGPGAGFVMNNFTYTKTALDAAGEFKVENTENGIIIGLIANCGMRCRLSGSLWIGMEIQHWILTYNTVELVEKSQMDGGNWFDIIEMTTSSPTGTIYPCIRLTITYAPEVRRIRYVPSYRRVIVQ